LQRIAHMTSVCLGVGCEPSPWFSFGLARKPPLLFRHRGGVRPEKAKSIESVMEYVIILFSRLRLVDALPCFVETLQGKGVVGDGLVRAYLLRRKPHSLPRDLRGFFILPLFAVHDAQTDILSGAPWVALNHLLILLDRLIQFPGHTSIVAGGDTQLFPFAGCSRNWNALV
jgi:hypothetical protein